MSTSSSRAKIVAVAALVVLPGLLALMLRAVYQSPTTTTVPVPVAEAPPPAPPPPPPAPVDIQLEGVLLEGEALSSALARLDIDSDTRSALVRVLKDHLDARSLRAGVSFTITQTPERVVKRFEMRTLASGGIPREIVAQRDGPYVGAEASPSAESASPAIGGFVARHSDAPIEVELAGVTGSIHSSLYQSMLELGEEPTLVDRFVDMFAWNIDFYRQPQRGDTFKVLVEKRRAGGRFLGYGNVVAAEYVNAGTVHRGFKFQSEDGEHRGVYDEAGSALMRTFLKSPMEIGRITSSYGMRFHPVLGRNKAHEGVDYGAPVGTPIWSVADGVVTESKYSKTAGNMVTIKHMNGFQTEYFHLSKFAEGMRAGARVQQKQIIGYVGTTGLSTGPHLHFGLLRNGGHVDPQRQDFPTAKPVPTNYRDEFAAFVAPLLAQLSALSRA